MKTIALALLLSIPLARAWAQQPATASSDNAQQARAALEAMVQALGGEAWLQLKNRMCEGRIASFYEGKPNLDATLFRETSAWPGRDRIEYTKSRDVVQIYGPDRAGWEITYKGKSPLPKEQTEAFLRMRDHSIEAIAHTWRNDPRAILLYEGRRLVQRRLADQVTLISAANDSVTLLIDAETHLPLRRSFEWRDPVYQDKNVDAEEYDNYRVIDGFPTPQAISRYKNGELTSQRFLTGAAFNQELPVEFWEADAVAKQLKK